MRANSASLAPALAVAAVVLTVSVVRGEHVRPVFDDLMQVVEASTRASPDVRFCDAATCEGHFPEGVFRLWWPDSSEWLNIRFISSAGTFPTHVHLCALLIDHATRIGLSDAKDLASRLLLGSANGEVMHSQVAGADLYGSMLGGGVMCKSQRRGLPE